MFDRETNHRRVAARSALIPLTGVIALALTTGGCNRSTSSPMQQAAEMLCHASKLGLNPPESAYIKYAKEMNTTADKIRAHAPSAAAAVAFADHIEKHAPKLPTSAFEQFRRLWSAVAGIDPKQKYELIESEFAEHKISLAFCPEIKRFLYPAP